jgi:hypothetical protein
VESFFLRGEIENKRFGIREIQIPPAKEWYETTSFNLMDDCGRPAIAFLIGQAVNVAWTLLVAYLLFGGILFSVPKLQ